MSTTAKRALGAAVVTPLVGVAVLEWYGYDFPWLSEAASGVAMVSAVVALVLVGFGLYRGRE
ncbi:hypothetical protein [Halomarina ordinaria]|uniref:Uncharacterized protein n=1 Tax=Halomarina ordinaria TaxID=3033939 RepID=A0ABD5UDT7_9EURY|nr:hypothetical protein [Halomarina sp. PSRA2]